MAFIGSKPRPRVQPLPDRKARLTFVGKLENRGDDENGETKTELSP